MPRTRSGPHLPEFPDHFFDRLRQLLSLLYDNLGLGLRDLLGFLQGRILGLDLLDGCLDRLGLQARARRSGLS